MREVEREPEKPTRIDLVRTEQPGMTNPVRFWKSPCDTWTIPLSKQPEKVAGARILPEGARESRISDLDGPRRGSC